MDHASHPRQVESAHHHTYSGPDFTNSATLPFSGASYTHNDTPQHHTAATMSHLHYQTADLSEVDDNVPEEAPTAHVGSTRGRGRGRGRVYRGKGKIAKPAPAKPVTGRGRRHKVYESARAQAAHERIQELKSAFATVAKVVKPASQEIADRSVNELLQDPELIRKVPEYENIQGFLRTRLADTKKTLNMQFKIDNDMVKHVYEGQMQIVQEAYTVRPSHPRLNRCPLTKVSAIAHRALR